MRTTRLILSLALASLLLAGCPGEDSTVPDAGTDPPQNLLMGEICVEDGQCVSDYCLKYTGDTEGYCTETGCVNDWDCVNHAEGEDIAMCCYEVEEAYMCLKVAEGYDCGSPNWCGDSCSADPDICGIDNPCMGEGELAICSQRCTTNADCANCSWSEDPHAEIRCIPVESDEKYCQIYVPVLCESHADCPEGETCTVEYEALPDEINPICATYGALPPGAACEDSDDPAELSFEERCSGLYCIDGQCSQVCESDADCTSDRLCLAWDLPDGAGSAPMCQGHPPCEGPVDCPEGFFCHLITVGDVLSGRCIYDEEAGEDEAEYCAGDEFCPEGLVCRPPNFIAGQSHVAPESFPTGHFCVADKSCASPADCPEGESCWPGLDDPAYGWCRTDQGATGLGESCSLINDTCQAYCFEGLCTEWCSLDEDCPAPMRCEDVPFCLAEPCDQDENVVLGSICVDEAYCNSPDDCAEGASCWISLAGSNLIVGRCQPDAGSDLLGASCDPDNDTCQAICVDGLCSEWCTFDSDCPGEALCKAVPMCVAEPCTDPVNISAAFICVPDRRCESHADCDEGYSCWPNLNIDNSLSGWCQPNEGSDPIGATCEFYAGTCEAACIPYESGGMCSEVCAQASDCPDGYDCQTTELCIGGTCSQPEDFASIPVCVPEA